MNRFLAWLGHCWLEYPATTTIASGLLVGEALVLGYKLGRWLLS